MYIIYLITNNFTGKHYVGITKHKLKDRISRHLYSAKSGSEHFIHASIRKHGWDAFTVQEIYNTVDRQHCKDMECHFITEYNSYAPGGYNKTIGGDHPPGELISQAKKGMKATWVVGNKYTENWVWYNNGFTSIRLKPNIQPPDGYVRGRINNPGPRLNGTKRPKFPGGYKRSNKPRKPRSEEHRRKISLSLMGTARAAGNHNVVGRIWVNDGQINKRVKPDSIPPGFREGRLKRQS